MENGHLFPQSNGHSKEGEEAMRIYSYDFFRGLGEQEKKINPDQKNSIKNLLTAKLPPVLADIVIMHALDDSSLLPRGLSFSSEMSKKNGITAVCRYSFQSAVTTEGRDVDMTDTLLLIMRGIIRREHRGGGLYVYDGESSLHFIDSGLVLIYDHLPDPAFILYNQTESSMKICESCEECYVAEGSRRCFKCLPDDFVLDDYGDFEFLSELKEQRDYVEEMNVDEPIISYVEYMGQALKFTYVLSFSDCTNGKQRNKDAIKRIALS